VIIPYLAMGAFLANLTHYITIPCSLHKKTLIMTRITIISAVVNILLYLVFIPWLGFVGVGVALISTYIFMIIYSLYSVRNFELIKLPWKMIFQTLIASGFMIFAVILLKSLSSQVWIIITASILGGGMVYILMLRLMGVWSFDKIRTIGKPDITP
jgi:peptidoglycan biosynthesis protein MviN/MurJ (putative lipid II flippase)